MKDIYKKISDMKQSKVTGDDDDSLSRKKAWIWEIRDSLKSILKYLNDRYLYENNIITKK
jgi:hypothetical protein